jgi:hypothetical protein
VSHARRFLGGLPCGGELAGVTAADVIGAVLRGVRGGGVGERDAVLCGGLAVVSAVLFFVGLVPVDLSQAALPATGRRRSLLPQGIGTARRVAFETISTQTSRGSRCLGCSAGGLGQSPSATELTR